MAVSWFSDITTEQKPRNPRKYKTYFLADMLRPTSETAMGITIIQTTQDKVGKASSQIMN